MSANQHVQVANRRSLGMIRYYMLVRFGKRLIGVYDIGTKKFTQSTIEQFHQISSHGRRDPGRSMVQITGSCTRIIDVGDYKAPTPLRAFIN